jgi:hypothetical protein
MGTMRDRGFSGLRNVGVGKKLAMGDERTLLLSFDAYNMITLQRKP